MSLFSRQTTHNDLHVDRLLTNLSVGYRNDTYIADKIFPIVPVQKQSDKYAVYTKADWFRDEAQLRAPGTEPVESGYNVSTTNTYFCLQYAIAKSVPDEVRANADDPLNPDREAVEFVTDRLMLRRENAWAAANFIAAAWATSSTGGTSDHVQWSNYGASDPTVDVLRYRNSVRGSIARLPNKGVIGFAALVQLQNHPVLVDRIKYSQKGILTEQLIAELLGLDELLVGSAIITTTPEPQTAIRSTERTIWTYGRIPAKVIEATLSQGLFARNAAP